MELPKRKNIRLRNYDYSQAGYYFVTVCTYKHISYLSRIVGGGFHAAPQIELTGIGLEVKNTIEYISSNYNGVTIDKYVIMPNHVHLIIIASKEEKGGRGNPPLQKVVGQFKSYTNKKFNEQSKSLERHLWQRNYYDHIIRNEADYQRIWEYIDTNALKWELDEYYN